MISWVGFYHVGFLLLQSREIFNANAANERIARVFQGLFASFAYSWNSRSKGAEYPEASFWIPKKFMENIEPTLRRLRCIPDHAPE